MNRIPLLLETPAYETFYLVLSSNIVNESTKPAIKSVDLLYENTVIRLSLESNAKYIHFTCCPHKYVITSIFTGKLVVLLALLNVS